MRWKKKYVAFALVFVLAILFYIKNKNASRKKICYHNLYDFTRTFASLSHSVIYYDPPESSISADLLTSRISAFSAPWSSDRECPPEKVSSFFTLAQANYTVAFRRLISLGFRLHKQTAAASTAFLDTSASSSAPVTSYFTLSRHRHHIELVLLYKVSSLGDVSSSHYAHYDTLSFGQSSYGRIPQLQKFVTDGITLRIPATYSSFNPFNSKHINCFNDRVLEYQNNYDLRVGEEGEKFRLNALSTLAIAAKALDQIGQEFWICSGTLLGWYRQCDVIAHSLDVDIGIRAADFNQEQLVDILAKFGLTLTQQLGTKEDSYELSFMGKYGIKLDIFFFYNDEKNTNNIWNGATDTVTLEKFKYTFKQFDLCWTSLQGVRVRVPCDSGPFVVSNYGLDWQLPVSTWDWRLSPANSAHNGRWSEDQRRRVVQIYDG